MPVTVEAIRALREQTSVGIMDCKRALEEAGGDTEKAAALLRERGIASAAKKASRATNEGLVETYVHTGGRVGAMVELNCETDFVARTDDFKALAHDIAMQVAAMAPASVSGDDTPEGQEEPPQESVLLQQPFIKDPSLTVQDLINEAVGKLGENVRVNRIARFSLGE